MFTSPLIEVLRAANRRIAAVLVGEFVLFIVFCALIYLLIFEGKA